MGNIQHKDYQNLESNAHTIDRPNDTRTTESRQKQHKGYTRNLPSKTRQQQEPEKQDEEKRYNQHKN